MLKVFEAFAGIGTQRMALRNLGIEHEVVAIAEIDKFAIKSYGAIHGETNNLGDISKIDVQEIPDHDLFTYSFPCQDVSISGKQGGLEKGSGTRSSLLWECNRVIESKKPKYLMLENVKNLVGKKFKPDFDKWLEHLESLGYTNYWQVLNAKDYGIPQNRERVFVISILGEHEPYVFPEKVELTSRLKDVLEDEVDEKFYLSEEKTKKLTLNMEKDATVSYNRKDGVKKEIDVVPEVIGGIGEKNFGSQYRQGNRVYDVNRVATALTASPVGNAGGYSTLYGNPEGLKTAELPISRDLRIRKLTPKECWRLMGCSDEDFHMAAYKKEQVQFKEDNKWNVKLKDVIGNQVHADTETFALNIINDFLGQVETSTEWKRYLKMPENENKQSVNIVIEKLAELGRSDYATNIIKCTESMETLLTLTEGNDQLHTVIIELDETVSTNTAKYMRITSEENLNPLKLSIILTLTKQITESKIFTSTLQQVNTCGFIESTSDSENDTENMLTLSLVTEGTYTRNSSSQLYKQAGNAIVVDVLEAIFRNMFLDNPE